MYNIYMCVCVIEGSLSVHIVPTPNCLRLTLLPDLSLHYSPPNAFVAIDTKEKDCP